MKHSLEYFSLHYLDMWLRHDRLYHESLNNGTREEKLIFIKKAATYYKVARNLPKEYDEDTGCARYEPIVKIIDKAIASDFSGDTVKSINKVQKKISKAYGDRGVLSITTKLLWLKIRDPIIIYDSQARKALNTEDGDLSGFYEAWRTEYSAHSNAIATVCAKLSSVSKYSCDQTIATPAYVQAISAQPWFQERVFDVYLWHKGQ
ncbi:MAG: hypothetical protein PHY54_01400 [Methylococcales bacterium]|nr:hypothetical protein [Methylococcales bacterium]